MFLPKFGSGRSDALIGTNGKEKVIAAFHHPYQHLLYQAVVRQQLEMIPLGQPILVGHHSEKPHRSHLKRIDQHFAKAQEHHERPNTIAGAPAR